MGNKILYIVSNLRRCGPTNQLLYLLSNLDRSVFDPSILTLAPEPEDSRIQDFREPGINIYELKMSRKQFAFRGHPVLKGVVRKLAPDLIHSQGLRSDQAASKIKDIPAVFTIRNDPFVDYSMKYGKMMGGWMAAKHLKLARKNPHVVLCSKSLHDSFLEKYELDIPYIQNGVDTDFYRPSSEEDKISLRKKYEFKERESILLTVGSLLPRKDVGTLIRAVLNMKADARLLILGEGPMEQELQSLAGGDHRIVFAGHQKDVRDFMHLSDFFVSASVSEGLPNTVLEAMACGLPVMLSDIPAHREIFSEKREDVFFSMSDDDELAGKIENRLTSDLFEDGENARQIVEREFSAATMSKKYQELYFKIIK